MNGINSPSGYYPSGGITLGQGAQGVQTSPYNIAPVKVPNQMISGLPSNQGSLIDRNVGICPPNAYINVPNPAAVTNERMQDMLGMRNQSGMYAGYLNGVNSFTNCVININNNQPDLVPSMKSQPFKIWHSPPGQQATPMQVPIQSLTQPLSALPAGFGVDALAMYKQMLDVSLAQVMQCQNNIMMLQKQLEGLGQAPMIVPPMQQNIQPFMIPMNQVISNIQAAPMMSPNMPSLNCYPLQAPIQNSSGPFGQYYFEPCLQQMPFSPQSLMSNSPSLQQTPMQAMPGWSPFAHSFSRFIPPRGMSMHSLGQFNGVVNQYPQGASMYQSPSAMFLGNTTLHPKNHVKADPDLSSVDRSGKSVKASSENYQQWASSMARACIEGKLGDVKQLLRNMESTWNIDENLADLGDMSPLCFVCKEGKFPELVAVLSNKVDGIPQSCNNEFRLALSLAAKSNGDKSQDIVKMLLSTVSKDDKGYNYVVSFAITSAHEAGNEKSAVEALNFIQDSERDKILSDINLSGTYLSENYQDITKKKETSSIKEEDIDSTFDVDFEDIPTEVKVVEADSGKILSYQKWQSFMAKSCNRGSLEDVKQLLDKRDPSWLIDAELPELGNLSPLCFVCGKGEFPELVDVLFNKENNLPHSDNAEFKIAVDFAAKSKGGRSKEIVKKLLSSLSKSDSGYKNIVLSAIKSAYEADNVDNLEEAFSFLSDSERIYYLENIDFLGTSLNDDFDVKGTQPKVGADPIDIVGMEFQDSFRIKNSEKLIHKKFMNACYQCNKTIMANFAEIKKTWPEFSLDQAYEKGDSPLEAICNAKDVSVEDKVRALKDLKELMIGEGCFDEEVSLNKLYSAIQYRNKDEIRLLEMAFRGTTRSQLDAKVDSLSDNYGEVKKISSYDKYSKVVKRRWVTNGGPLKLELGSWDTLEQRRLDKDVSEDLIVNSLADSCVGVAVTQKVDDWMHGPADLNFMDGFTPKKDGWFEHGSVIGVATTDGEVKVTDSKIHVDINLKISGTNYHVTALFDHHDKDERICAELASSHFEDKIENILSSNLKYYKGNSVIAVRESLKQALVEVNLELGEDESLDRTGLDATVMLTFKNKDSKTEIWTSNLGKSSTSLLHPDGRVEQLSLDTGDNKTLGYNLINSGTSARGSVTRRVLNSNEDPNKIAIIQVNDALRKKCGIQAIGEVARQLETEKNNSKKVGYTNKSSPVMMENLAKCLVRSASGDSESVPMHAVVRSLNTKNTKNTKLPCQKLSAEAIKNRLRFMPKGEHGRHNKEDVAMLVSEINHKYSGKKASAEKNNLLLTLYVEMLTVYGEEKLLPDEVINLAKTKDSLISDYNKDKITVLTDIRDLDRNHPLTSKLIRHNVAQLASAQINNLGASWKEAMVSMYDLSMNVTECIDFSTSIPSLKPYVDSLRNPNSVIHKLAISSKSGDDFYKGFCYKFESKVDKLLGITEDVIENLAIIADGDRFVFTLLLNLYNEKVNIKGFSLSVDSSKVIFDKVKESSGGEPIDESTAQKAVVELHCCMSNKLRDRESMKLLLDDSQDEFFDTGSIADPEDDEFYDAVSDIDEQERVPVQESGQDEYFDIEEDIEIPDSFQSILDANKSPYDPMFSDVGNKLVNYVEICIDRKDYNAKNVGSLLIELSDIQSLKSFGISDVIAAMIERADKGVNSSKGKEIMNVYEHRRTVLLRALDFYKKEI